MPLIRQFLTLSLLLFAALPAPDAAADELLMRDGSRLIGTVKSREGNILKFKTTYAGVINVKWDQISELRADKPMKFLLDDDEIIYTRSVTNNTDNMVVEGESGLPDQTLGQSEVTYINPEPWRTGEGYKLTGIVNFGIQKERGNTDKDELDVDGNLLWRSRHDRIRVFGELERDRNNNKKTKDKWKLNNAYNHFFSNQWYAGASLALEHDQFANLDLRTSVGPLMGYQWFESREINLSTEGGLLYVNENFLNESDDDYVSLGWGINFDKFIFRDVIQFYHRQNGLWNLEDTGDVVWDTWTGLRFPIFMGIVTSTELQVDYDSGAAEDADTVDTTFSVKIGYGW